jgi:hypothetical protein
VAIVRRCISLGQVACIHGETAPTPCDYWERLPEGS